MYAEPNLKTDKCTMWCIFLKKITCVCRAPPSLTCRKQYSIMSDFDNTKIIMQGFRTILCQNMPLVFHNQDNYLDCAYYA